MTTRLRSGGKPSRCGMTAKRLAGEPTFSRGRCGFGFIAGSFREGGWYGTGQAEAGGGGGEGGGGGGVGPPPPPGGSGGGDSGQDPGLGLLTDRQVVRLAVGGGQAGCLTGGVAGVQGVEGHRGGDLDRPQGDPAAGLAVGRGGPRLGGEIVGQDGDPVALQDRCGGPGGQEAERGDLHPAGDAVAGAAGGDVEGQAELDAVGAVAGGEAAGVVAEAAGDGDADRVHGFSLVRCPGGPAVLVAALGCGALPGGQVAAPGTGRARIPGSPGGEDVLPAVKGASAGAAGTKGSRGSAKDLCPPGSADRLRERPRGAG